ncbi:hypothetical protein TcWFU_004934 [Taenia crassiceps]|uniref:Uncharacterized protein n=1 Tax=Taenia crassiceps TaxID=6207 RepID=A0ABR4QAQ9_9CEST
MYTGLLKYLAAVLLLESLRSWEKQLAALRRQRRLIANHEVVTGLHEDSGNTQTQELESPPTSLEDGDDVEVVSVDLVSHSDDDSSQECWLETAAFTYPTPY